MSVPACRRLTLPWSYSKTLLTQCHLRPEPRTHDVLGKSKVSVEHDCHHNTLRARSVGLRATDAATPKLFRQVCRPACRCRLNEYLPRFTSPSLRFGIVYHCGASFRRGAADFPPSSMTFASS